MKKFNIPKIKLPELKEETKDKLDDIKDKVIDGAKITAKTLLGLFALGVCLKGCASCCRIQEQRAKAQEALDKKTPVTLIGKSITPSRCCDDKKDITLLFDADGNPQTVEATFDIRDIKSVQAIPFYNLTNGTTKSVFEWKKMVPPYERSTYSK